jgi:hypothetical protein
MATQVVDRANAERCGAEFEMSPGQRAAVRYCDACGAQMVVAAEARPIPLVWGAIWFCDACALTLSAGEADRLAREWALRGVPLS